MTGLHRDDTDPYEPGEPAEDPKRIATSRVLGQWLVVLGLTLLVVLGVAVWARIDAGNAIAAAEENGQRVEQNADRANERDQLLQAQIDQFERCVGKPANTPGCTVAVAPEPEDLPDPVPPVPAPPPEPPDLMTDAEVRTIVAQELLQHDAKLSDAQIERVARVAAGLVPKPKDGVTPSETQVRAVVTDVVAAVCANDACKGADGVPGEPGEDALPVTDAQIDARLAAYCAARPDGDCDGPKGNTGADGVPGKPGRGIVSQDCLNDTSDAGSHWLIRYDAEPFEVTVPGPCRVKASEPAPTVPPDPNDPPTP